MIERESLLEIGKKKGLKNTEHVEKNYFQDVFLFNIFKKTNKFVFKGGTALYKLYNLPRFSEDLDFSIIEGTEYKEAEEIVEETLKQIQGFEIKSVKKTEDSILVKVGINGILTKYNTLRIDINTKNKILTGFDVKVFVSDYIDINPFSLRSLKTEEMVAEKIHSILARKRARDLFDLFFLLRMSNFNLDLVRQKLKIFGIVFDSGQFAKKIKELEDLWEPELRPFVLAELFPFNTAKNFVLEKLPKF